MGTYQNILNPKVSDYLIEKYHPLDDSFRDFRKKAEEENVPIILPDAECLICNLIRLKKPSRILEIGTAVGYSASCFAKVSAAHVDTVEISPDNAEIASDNIEALGLSDRISIHVGDGEKIVNGLPFQYDFVFIDAAKSHYKRFLDACLKKTSSDALIVCDNVLFKARTVSDEYDPGKKYKTNIRKMREFIDYLMGLENIHTSLVAVGDGLTISILER